MRKELINKLKILSDTELKNAFPYEDIGQMEEYFDDKLSDEHSLTGDFNEFIMLIAGSASYVLSNKEVPKYQMHFLDKDFSLYILTTLFFEARLINIQSFIRNY